MNFFNEIIAKDKRFANTEVIHDVELLEPITRKLVLQIIEDAKAHGEDYMIFETYRSKERQELLFDQGATKLKKVGVHHYGLACDVVKCINGQPSWKGDFSLIGQLAHAHGLIWGGDWGNPNIKHTFFDPYHLQRVSLKKQPALFAGTWYPDENYNPYLD